MSVLNPASLSQWITVTWLLRLAGLIDSDIVACSFCGSAGGTVSGKVAVAEQWLL